MTEWLSQPVEYWRSGGLLLVPLAAVCFAIWAYFLRARRELTTATHQGRQLLEALSQSETGAGAALELSDVVRDATSGPFRTACLRALALMQEGTPAREALDREGASEMRRMGRDLIVLTALTLVAPLVGLLGTVIGMVETFDGVAGMAGDTAGRVASGVSQALITTQFGLVVAIPGVFGLARLKRLSAEVGTLFGAMKTHIIIGTETP